MINVEREPKKSESLGVKAQALVVLSYRKAKDLWPTVSGLCLPHALSYHHATPLIQNSILQSY